MPDLIVGVVSMIELPIRFLNDAAGATARGCS